MPRPQKPRALRPGDAVRVISLSSPIKEERLNRGCDELAHLGFTPRLDRNAALAQDGFFAGTAEARLCALKAAFAEPETFAVFCTRGGYGSNYLLDLFDGPLGAPKVLCGFSDVTSLQVFLWQKFAWVTLYGPMVAAGLDHGANSPEGYDPESLMKALVESHHGWKLPLQGEPLSAGSAEGTLLGGCLNLVEGTLGTPWELETRDSILILEDRAMKPWHVDRALMHLKQAGKFAAVRGIILGDFPESVPPPGTESVKEVAQRILSPLKIPIAWGVPVGHTSRPMLTLPLGVRARLSTDNGTELEILERACVP